MRPSKYKVNDTVRSRYGHKPMVILQVCNYCNNSYRYYVQYIGSKSTKTLNEGDIVPYEKKIDSNDRKDTVMKGKLFQTNDGRFGVGLAINSQGLYVLEMKSGGSLEAFNKADIELVMPFTYAVVYANSKTEYQYLGKEGSVAVGDLLLQSDGSWSVGKVTAINTKSDRATKHFNGVKLVTQPLESE